MCLPFSDVLDIFILSLVSSREGVPVELKSTILFVPHLFIPFAKTTLNNQYAELLKKHEEL